MIYLIPLGFVTAALLVWSCQKLSDLDNSMGWMLMAIPSGLALLGCVLIPTITYPSRSVGHTTCRNWSSQTGIQTKFVVLNWADSGTCLAKTPSGRWIPNDQWAAFVKGSK